MRKGLIVLVAALMTVGAAALGMTVGDALGLFSGDEIMIPYSEEGRAQLEAMIDTFRDALGVTDALNEANEGAVMAFDVDPAHLDIMNKLAQCYYTLADVFLGEDVAVLRPVYLKGKHWGLKAMRIDPEFAELEESKGFEAAVKTCTNLEGMYWASSNWLRVAEFNPLEAVFAGVPSKAEAIILRCMELDETYTHYGSYRALGAFWSGLPAAPLLYYSKNWNRSLGYFCKIVDEPEICGACRDCVDHGEVDPAVHEYLENRLFFVEFYLMERGLWEDAHRVILSILEDGIGEKYPLYNAVVIERAEGFLEQVEAKR